jgi:hypothetical protein
MTLIKNINTKLFIAVIQIKPTVHSRHSIHYVATVTILQSYTKGSNTVGTDKKSVHK